MKTKNDPYTVYMLSCADKTLYTGITNNISKRLNAHNAGTASKYTRPRTPVKLVYTEKVADRSEATKREREIKLLTKQEKESLIKSNENL